MAREIPKLPTTTGPGKLITESPLWNSYLIEKNFITHAVLSTSCLYFCNCIFTHHGADTFGQVADWFVGQQATQNHLPRNALMKN